MHEFSTQTLRSLKINLFLKNIRNHKLNFDMMQKKKINFWYLLILLILLSGATNVFAQSADLEINGASTSEENTKKTDDCTDDPVYKKMIALKKKYPEGKRWTNRNRYGAGRGCAAFAFLLSDAAFGENPYRKHRDLNNMRVGDILRINKDTHSVVILCINETTITLAEGNFNSSIHWGRKMKIKDLKRKINYVLTRYPE